MSDGVQEMMNRIILCLNDSVNDNNDERLIFPGTVHFSDLKISSAVPMR